ncbi:hypothetical protein Leryth_009039 [Lithospermum erythrorhizon]|nr:hypothetical protein Leryth_009039 [Lithospermum erythrorhizon]
MQPLNSIFFILTTLLISLNPSLTRFLLQNAAISCPLNFTLLTTLSPPPTSATSSFRCQYLRLGLRLLLADHLRRTSAFLPPLSTSSSCFNSYKNIFENFDIEKSCNITENWSAQGCLNISTRFEFEARVKSAELESLKSKCSEMLVGSTCSACIESIVALRGTSLGDEFGDNIIDCPAFASIYAAAIANRYGPEDSNTAKCLFYIDLVSVGKSSSRRRIVVVVVIVVVCVVVFVVVVVGLVVCVYRKWIKPRKRFRKTGSSVGFYGLDFSMEIVSLKEFSFDEVKVATKNFSRDNIIGSGTYGNVYRGVLSDGTEVALKRFKNLTVAGSETFKHELEIIASVRHVNLVGLIGYCTWETAFEGNHRIIVCDLLKNGSLYDYLFGSRKEKLSWPDRRKIALGTARGLAYLHNGAQPAIIHRDVKSSNILLDETFEPKVADFGMAKFTPEGMTHVSTRVSGTMGYVAPEYALYGRLTERSDVYSFGVVLLELLTGKKAFTTSDGGQVTLLIDWVWSFVQEGRALDVIEDNMQDLDPPKLMEKYIKIGVLCSHTQLYARPTMSEVVKLLDDDIPVPIIPDRPVSFVANINNLERSVSTFGSGPPATSSG